MTKRRKQALILLGIATPVLAFGITNYELNGMRNSVLAILVSISITGGVFCAFCGLLMLCTKNPLGVFNDKKPETSKKIIQKPIKEEKDMSKSNNETREIAHELTEELGVEVYRAKAEVDPVVSEDNESKSESLLLMQSEKSLVLKILETKENLEALENDWKEVISTIKQKGWVLAEDGTWKID
jgi:hypothetical protein